MNEIHDNDILIALARQAVETYVAEGRELNVPDDLPPELQRRSAVFICLKKHGRLRGCIGTIEPAQPNLASEIIRNAISAAVSDPRFEPVSADELDDLTYTVDILTPPEPVSSWEELNPKRYGVIVQSGIRRGLLLPDLEGVDTVEEQVNIALQKAGIRNDEPYSLFRFEVQRHTQE